MGNNQTPQSVDNSEPLALLRVLKDSYTLEEAAKRIALLNENEQYRRQLEIDVLAMLYDAANNQQLRAKVTFQGKNMITRCIV